MSQLSRLLPFCLIKEDRKNLKMELSVQTKVKTFIAYGLSQAFKQTAKLNITKNS